MKLKIRYFIAVVVFCWLALYAWSDPPMGPIKYNLYTTNNTGAVDAHVASIAAGYSAVQNFTNINVYSASGDVNDDAMAVLASAEFSGNVDARSFIGDGSQLTGLTNGLYPIAGGPLRGNLLITSNNVINGFIKTNGYAFLRFLSVSNGLDSGGSQRLDFNPGTGVPIALIPPGGGGSNFVVGPEGHVYSTGFYGDGSGLVNLPSTTYGGTISERNSFTPPGSFALWILTDTTPPLQISVWANGQWN